MYMKFGLVVTFIKVNKSPFVFKETIMTTSSTLENYMIGVIMLLKENTEKLDQTNKKDGDRQN